MSLMTLRPATPADIPAITAIYAHAVLHGTASFELEPPDEAEMAQRFQALVDAGFPYLVAEAGEGLAGYAYAGAYRPRPAYRWTVEDSIYIAPGQQGRGVGRLLLTELIARCTAQGFRQMIAVIGDAASEGSIRLHAALGFEPAGHLKAVGFKHGQWRDGILMQRALGAGQSEPPEAVSR